jgi:hypothetical protein
MAVGAKGVWQWTNTDFEWHREEEQAVVQLHAADRQPGHVAVESCSCQIVIPWQARQSEKVARLTALKRLRTLIDAEITDLQASSPRRED